RRRPSAPRLTAAQRASGSTPPFTRRPNIHTHFVGRQREDGLDTLPARAAEANRSTLIADIPFPALETSQPSGARAKTSVLRACRVANPAKRLNVMQGPKPLFEPQRSMTSRS